LQSQDESRAEQLSQLTIKTQARLKTMPRYQNLRAWILALRSDNTLGVEQLRIPKAEIYRKLETFFLSNISVSESLERLDPAHKRPVLTHTSRKLKDDEAVIALEYIGQQACDLAVGKCWITLPLWVTGSSLDQENFFQSSLCSHYGQTHMTIFDDNHHLQTTKALNRFEDTKVKSKAEIMSRRRSTSFDTGGGTTEFEPTPGTESLNFVFILDQVLLSWTCEQTAQDKPPFHNSLEILDKHCPSSSLVIHAQPDQRAIEMLSLKAMKTEILPITSTNRRRMAGIKWYESTIESTQAELTSLLLRKSKLINSLVSVENEQDEEELRHVLNTEEAVLQGRLEILGRERREMRSALKVTKPSSPAKLPNNPTRVELPNQNTLLSQTTYSLKSNSTSTYETDRESEEMEIAEPSPRILERPWDADDFNHFAETMVVGLEKYLMLVQQIMWRKVKIYITYRVRILCPKVRKRLPVSCNKPNIEPTKSHRQ
jgi:hypothetical protein